MLPMLPTLRFRLPDLCCCCGLAVVGVLGLLDNDVDIGLVDDDNDEDMANVVVTVKLLLFV